MSSLAELYASLEDASDNDQEILNDGQLAEKTRRSQ